MWVGTEDKEQNRPRRKNNKNAKSEPERSSRTWVASRQVRLGGRGAAVCASCTWSPSLRPEPLSGKGRELGLRLCITVLKFSMHFEQGDSYLHFAAGPHIMHPVLHAATSRPALTAKENCSCAQGGGKPVYVFHCSFYHKNYSRAVELWF